MDTGPLWTFAQVGRLDLLGVRIAHRMIWTGAVHSEIDRNVQNHALLADVLDLEWLPEPVQLEGPLALRAFEVRAGLSAPRITRTNTWEKPSRLSWRWIVALKRFSQQTGMPPDVRSSIESR